MARAYSQDLRDRVIDAALSGKSARVSAAQFGVGVATAIVWVRRAREAGNRAAHKQGGTKGCKLDSHREFLLSRIEKTPDLTISELVERLSADHGVKVARSILWGYLDRCGLTFKKRLRTPANRVAPTSPYGENSGLKANPTLILKSSCSSTKRG